MRDARRAPGAPGYDVTVREVASEVSLPERAGARRLLRAIRPVRTLSFIVAEDDHFMREWLSLSLQDLSAIVVQAANGHQLLALLAERPDVDLVISDIRMPGTSGLEALALARSGGSEVPFLLITGYGSSDVLAAASELGAVVLQKPFSRRDLLSRVTALCHSPPADDEPAARLAHVSDEPK